MQEELKDEKPIMEISELDKMISNLAPEQKALFGMVKETLNNFKKDEILKHHLDTDTDININMCVKDLEDGLNPENPDVKEYLTLGSFCLLLGYEIYTRKYPNEITSISAYNKIKDYILEDRKMFETWLEHVNKFSVDDINHLKDQIIKGNDMICKEIDGNSLHYKLERFLKNSIIDVKFSKEVVDLLDASRNPTYQTILKINNMIYQYAEWIGDKATSNIVDLISSETWTNAIQKAQTIYTHSRFGLVLYDALLSVKEMFLNEFCPIIHFIDAITQHNLSEQGYFQDWEENWQKHLEKNKPEQTEEQTKSEQVEKFEPTEKFENVDFQTLMMTDPSRCFLNVLEDYNKCKLSDDNFIEFVDNLMNDESGYGNDILKFIKSSVSNEISDSVTFTKGSFNIDIDNIKSKVNDLISDIRADYKNKAETICQEIPESFKINDKINSIIQKLILKSFDEKQYLLSQYLSPQIKTYQHLIQMLNLIEGGQIQGLEGHQHYNNLYNLVNENWKDILTDGVQLDVLHVKLSFYMAVNQLLNKISQ
jgi:hypothetical protein